MIASKAPHQRPTARHITMFGYGGTTEFIALQTWTIDCFLMDLRSRAGVT